MQELTPMNNVFGHNVSRIRLSKKWTQEQLSEKANLHRTYVSGIERGVRNPTLSIIYRIAAALGVEASVLLQPRKK